MYIICALLGFITMGETPDSLSFEIPEITVTATIKHNTDFSEQPLSASSFSESFLETNRINEPKNLSLAVPNFVQADYGSKMTSSIYVRGIGARMEQPSIGLYIDNIPILNKNNYDIDLYDIKSIYVLRGPQGTLFGRNTIGGVIDIHTRSPLYSQGTSIQAGYGNGNASELRISTYQKPSSKFGITATLNHRYSNGFFTNEYDGTPADRILSEGARLKMIFRINSNWSIENIVFANFIKQNGFAYSLYDESTNIVQPINHNDPCSYERFNITDGLTFRYIGEEMQFSATTSYQYTADNMILDQDFRTVSMFTLQQIQKEHALTQEFVWRSTTKQQWQWITGGFGFYKHTNMNAPVTFKSDGIDELILENANKGIHTVFPDADLLIKEKSFLINSRFKLPTYGFSIFHQSTFHTGNWQLAAGLRTDYEHTAITYNNDTEINYRFTLTMPGYKTLPLNLNGNQSKSYFEFTPRLSATYNTNIGILYATIARGYKAGGYNTQIFSDILQNKMMTKLMSDLGIYFENDNSLYDISSAISYKPEYSWNYEIGSHLRWLDKKLNLNTCFFYIDLRNQQLTIFPPGKTTGRLMSNAGHSRSLGMELTVTYQYKAFSFMGSYGYTNAKFISYRTGNENYSGKYAPYVPQNTISTICEYKLPMPFKWTKHLMFNIGWQGMGKIYWNETNTISQPFYGLLNASIILSMKKISFGIWGKNLTGINYNTFYFKSVGHSFVQRGKPVQFGINSNIHF